MSIRQLDHLNLTVRDLDLSLDWYHRVFGFDVVEQGTDPHGRWAIVRSGEGMLCLYERPTLSDPETPYGAQSPRHGINHIGFRISDRAAWERTVQEQEVRVRYGGEVAWPHSSSWYVTDPTGHEIEVVWWRDDTIRFDAAA